MRKYALLSYGFKQPTPEIMTAWKKWFDSIKGNMVEMIGFGAGRELSAAGIKVLPLDLESLTGMVIVNAESLDEAQKIAAANPYISSIRIYELR
jgi:hypothetical protein